MALTIPSLDSLHQRILDDYAARFPGDDVSRYSDNWLRTRVLAGAVWQILHGVKVARDDVLPDSAAGAWLDRIGEVYGVERRGATPARKADALRVFGAAGGGAVVVGDLLTHASGLQFQVNEAAAVPAAPGFVDVDVVGVDTGSQTKLQAEQTLTFNSAPSGVEAEAELQLDLDEDGQDSESDGEYRVRILEQIAQPAMGGNALDYRKWALEVDGIASAYPYPIRRGRGSFDLAALHTGRGSVRPLSSAEIAELQAYIDARRPASMKLFRVLEVTTSEQDVELMISILPGFSAEWDWDDTGGPLLVQAWTSASRTLQFQADRPGDMLVGDRIVVKDAALAGDGRMFEIEAFSGTDSVVLVEDPGFSPALGDEVYSGGDLTNSVRDAVLEHMDSLGPAIGDHGYGDWLDDLDPDHLLAIALQVDGVRRGETVEPAIAVTPSDPEWPNDETIELIIPRRVIVRREV